MREGRCDSLEPKMKTPLLQPPDFLGLMLTSRCLSRCGHCLYNCGPDRREELTPLDIEALLSDLLELGLGHVPVHLGGGEPFLAFPLLLAAAARLTRMGFRIDFVETGGSWFASKQDARARFLALQAAGVRRILVSADPFHQSFVAPSTVRAILGAASGIFGTDNVLLNSPQLLALVEGLSPEKTLTFGEFVASAGRESAASALLAHMRPLQIAGRAPGTLKDFFPRFEAGTFAEDCSLRVIGKRKWHFGPGRYVQTGYCAGLAFPLKDGLARWLRSFNLADWPVVRVLAGDGLQALVLLAGEEAGFRPDPEGYLSACHLCQEARLALWKLGRYEELGPDGFYQELLRESKPKSREKKEGERR